jgi:hypothetical protein
MKVDDKTSEILGRNFELSIDDAERLYNIGNFEKFSYSKIMSRAGQDLLLETAKTPVRLLGAVGQIPYAVETGANFIRDRLPSSIKTDGNIIFGGKTAVDIMGKAKSVGDTLMEVSSRTLDEMNKQAEKVLPRLSPEEQESTFNTYAQVGTQLGALLGLSMMSPKAGLDYITALTLGGETEEGFETYKAKNKGSMEGYGEQAGRDLFANLANTAIQRKIEGLIGVPGKMKFFRSAKELGRAGLYAGVTGWLEEGTQGLTDAVIDDFNGRLEGQFDKDGKPLTWWTKWLSQVQEINAAAVVQGAMGVGFALNNRASVKNEIKSIVEKHVEPEKVNEVVNTVYDSMDLSVKNVVAKELEMSSSLQTKRGEVYEGLYKAALEQVKVAKEQGGFPELQTEEDIANYVKSVADDFADETLAEAHRRNTVIEDVLDPSLIRYENGQLVMPMTKGTEGFDADKIMAERTTEFSYDEILHKLRFEEMSAEEEQRLTDMLDVEKQRLAPLFDTARGVVEELENEYGLVNELTDLSDAITERKMSFKEARDALGESFPEEHLADLGDEIKLKDGVKGNSAEIGFEYLTNRVFDRYDELRAKAQNYRLLQESLDIANQNAELDANNPAYEGETININGVERTVYNSNGDRIAMSEPALRNFYNWFGDSKVVDEQGRPLVVYHGTSKVFDTFDKLKRGYLTGANSAMEGFWFASGKDTAQSYAEYSAENGEIQKLLKKQMQMEKMPLVNWAEYDKLTEKIEELQAQGEQETPVVMPVYLKAENVGTYDANNQKFMDIQKEINDFLQISKDKDGVIIYNLKDAVNPNKTPESVTHIMVREPNQIKSTSNRGTYSESDNIYHQGGEDKNLIVYHNISANNLSKAIDFGGLPAPSIAIVNKNQDFGGQFGDITLVGNKEIIDPSRRVNEVYNRDVWSKTFPTESYGKVQSKIVDKFNNLVKGYFEKVGATTKLSDLMYRARRNIDLRSVVDEFIGTNAAKLMYVENELGESVDIPTYDIANKKLERMSGYYGFDMDGEIANKLSKFDSYPSEDVIKNEILPIIEEAIDSTEFTGEEEYADKLRVAVKELFVDNGVIDTRNIEGIIRDSKDYVRSSSGVEVDTSILTTILNSKINDDNAYYEWAKGYIEANLVGEPMVMVGKKLLPFNLQNVTDAMIQGSTKASQTSLVYGPGKVIAEGAKRLNTIEEIKLESKKLVSKEEQEQVINKLIDDMHSFTNAVADLFGASDFISAKEDSFKALGVLARQDKISKEAVAKALNKELGVNKKYSDEVLESGVEIIKSVKNLSRYYFEAKPQRAVRINEFSGAIIPTSSNFDAVADKVEKLGLRVVRSDNQLEAVKEFDDVLFQKGVGREKGSIQFKGDKALITLTEEANSSTLAHELAHYWLQNTFLYSKSGLATPEYKQFFNSIAKYLDITDDQETIKEWQQEKWARAAEMYAMGKAPEGMEGPLTQYQQWIRKAYGEMSEPMYIDENGEAKVPEFDFETMKMFANLAGETLTEPEFKQKQESVRGLAKSTNQMAQAKGMTTELPTYEKRSATDMGKKADEFIQRDKQLAIDIVKGLKPEQEGLFRQDLFAALRELALNEGDSDLLNELSKSMTVEEATELGQRIQALARGRIDPVKQMVELRDERMKKNKVDKKKLKEETEKAKKEIKKEMAEASTPKEWADFIKSLEC